MDDPFLTEQLGAGPQVDEQSHGVRRLAFFFGPPCRGTDPVQLPAPRRVCLRHWCCIAPAPRSFRSVITETIGAGQASHKALQESELSSRVAWPGANLPTKVEINLKAASSLEDRREEMEQKA